MRELLVASANDGKIREIREFLRDTPFAVIGLKEKRIEKEVDEVGNTFEGNALIKAMTYGKWANTLTLAEDSGLEIDALGGRPGVHTKPYTAGTSDNAFQKIFDEMKDVPEERRGAQFHSTIVVYDAANDKIRICEGIARGSITHEAIGTNNFGQDPIFRYADTGKTGGEMSLGEKNAVSHRGKALAKAKEVLLKEFI
jgi:XTP/dITP diphosphohydrolase